MEQVSKNKNNFRRTNFRMHALEAAIENAWLPITTEPVVNRTVSDTAS